MATAERVEAPPPAMAATPAPAESSVLVGTQDRPLLATAEAAESAASPAEAASATTARLPSPASPSISPKPGCRWIGGQRRSLAGDAFGGTGGNGERGGAGGNGGNATGGNGGNAGLGNDGSGGGIKVFRRATLVLKPRLGAKKRSKQASATDVITANSASGGQGGTPAPAAAQPPNSKAGRAIRPARAEPSRPANSGRKPVAARA